MRFIVKMLGELEETSNPMENFKNIVLSAFLKQQPIDPRLSVICKELQSRIDSCNSIKTVVLSPRVSTSKSQISFGKGGSEFDWSTQATKTPSKQKNKMDQLFNVEIKDSPKILRKSIILDVN